MSMSSSTERKEERDEYSSSNTHQRQQHEAAIRSIDETKEEIHRSIEQVRTEMPRYSQTITDFRNETADASMEIADNFLESQKEVINSLQSAWAPMAERIGRAGGAGGHYWTTGMMRMLLSPREMADIYARTIGAMTEAYVASAHMATNLVFAGIEAARATTNYARQNVKEGARFTSNTARTFAQTAAKETVQVEGEQPGGSTTGSSSSFAGVGGAAASSIESTGAATTARTTYTNEGTAPLSGETGSTTAGTGAATETTTGLTGKDKKKVEKR